MQYSKIIYNKIFETGARAEIFSLIRIISGLFVSVRIFKRKEFLTLEILWNININILILRHVDINILTLWNINILIFRYRETLILIFYSNIVKHNF